MGKRRGISIHIRDHESEALIKEVDSLRDEVGRLKAQLYMAEERYMATMQEVQQQMQDTVARVQAMGSVVQGVQTVVAELVRQVDALEPLVGNPDALMEGINSIRTAANAYQGTLAAAVAMGTASENEPAPQDGPVPMQVPNQAARDAGIRDPRNVRAMQAMQGQNTAEEDAAEGAAVDRYMAQGQQPQQQATEEGDRAPAGGNDLNAPQNAAQAGQQARATPAAQQTQNGTSGQQSARQGQVSNPDAQPGQMNPPAEGFNPDTSRMGNRTEGQPANAQQATPDVRNPGDPQPARAAQRNDGTTR